MLLKKILGRDICNFKWIDSCNKTSCHTLIKSNLDHYPILLKFNFNDVKYTSQFKFMNMWTNNLDCREIMEKTWSTRIYGYLMYILDKN